MRGTANVVVTGKTGNVAVTVYQIINRSLDEQLASAETELVGATRLVEQLRNRESELLGQLAEATADRDRLREEIARTKGRISESEAEARLLRKVLSEQFLVFTERLSDLTRRCGEAEYRITVSAAELAAVRGQLGGAVARFHGLRTRQSALVQAKPYIGDVVRRDRILSWTLLFMAVGAVCALLGGYGVASGVLNHVAAPLAAVVIVGTALFVGRWTQSLTLMVPTLLTVWLMISGSSAEDLVVIIAVGGSLVVIVMTVASFRQRDPVAMGTVESPVRSAIGTTIVVFATVLPVSAAGLAFGGTEYVGWRYAPFVISFTCVVAQTTWMTDRRERMSGAVAGVIYAALQILAVAGFLSGASATTRSAGTSRSVDALPAAVTTMVIFAVLCILGIAAFAITISGRKDSVSKSL
ncbi:hypothetical protein Lfu02_73310 [Longispora fulva]|uniref:Uncharacterized protein n=1 Tax=Longispora fulva TaxID=619741 RepID=A0A8J7KME3_9ACTN|nr:hypothetical protein [Longispora fulva]MBG6133917.1 hypothetical protein [Longispora fulva]GIG62959.1 hypothetical protein Lfu02_73310 [Longispora fulva]